MFKFILMTSWCCYASNLETPLIMSASEVYHFDATTESASGELTLLRFYLRFFSQSLGETLTEIVRLGTLADFIRVPIQRISHGFSSTSLDITPYGSFVHIAGPVAIVRHEFGNRIVFNVTQQYWTDNCLENSVLTFPVNATEAPDLSVPSDISFRIAGGESGFPSVEWNGRLKTSVSGLLVQTIAAVPTVVIERIQSVLLHSGALETPTLGIGRREYRNCTTAMIQSLPDFTIEWPSLGQLVFPGPDYMHHNSTDNTCFMKLRPLYRHDAAVISPLLFHQINIRISEDSIQFCDPRV